jgi:hypothetical protein
MVGDIIFGGDMLIPFVFVTWSTWYRVVFSISDCHCHLVSGGRRQLKHAQTSHNTGMVGEAPQISKRNFTMPSTL